MRQLLHKPLNDHDVYPCPVCRHGEVAAMPLMEALACNFCHHIFTLDLEQQVLKMVDSQLPLTWYWTGQTWKRIQKKNLTLGWVYGFLSLGFVILPTSLTGLCAYIFPPIPHSPLSWLPVTWVLLTAICHSAIISWLLIAYYQFPLKRYLQEIRQQLLTLITQ